MSKIIILSNADIDYHKWDKVVLNASNSRVYAETWYLDIICPNWSGLIYGDYDFIMPIVSAKKMGIRYIYQPTYAQQHGIFPPANTEILAQFIGKIKDKYLYINTALNASCGAIENTIDVQLRKNFTVSLNDSIENLVSNYNSHAKRYVRKANKACTVVRNVSLEDFVTLKMLTSDKKNNQLIQSKLKPLISGAIQNQRGKIYGVYNENDQLLAAAFFVTEKKRFTYLNSVSSDKGKKIRAMYAIINTFIHDHAKQQMLLDFEGSDIDGIARFFMGFGAKLETYQNIKYNNLPWYLKLLKR
ncbi:hypothetical protein OAA06_00330 [bacterium]|nr:hypothetical protein [bacterium]